ncbi:MAG: peptidyl-prolyl cis-trans isomerase, partial [Eubacterium sp.]|nr:peptidyl-prolyl cis-trans isomerase [Eubacterium sp.]
YGMDWDSDNGGSTLSSSVKKQIMDTLKQREVLCMQAEKDGTTLTDEEQKEVDTAVEEAMNAMPEESKGKKGLSESDFRASIDKQKLADKEKQHIIDGFDIDDEAIKNEINKGEYRQYTIQYYTITKMDEDANKASDGDEEKMKDEETLKKDKAEMEALQKRAKAGEDFEKLLTDSDGDQKDDTTGISYATKDLIETDADFADAQVRDQIKLMKNDEISGVIEGNEAYYVVKMINNDDPAAYDNEVKNRISTEENDQYTKYYDETVLPQYTITVQDYWSDRVNIGHITVPAK